jgi:hypothetical protein
VLRGFPCNCIYPQTALAFLAGGSVLGLGNQRVKDHCTKDLFEHILVALRDFDETEVHGNSVI